MLEVSLESAMMKRRLIIQKFVSLDLEYVNFSASLGENVLRMIVSLSFSAVTRSDAVLRRFQCRFPASSWLRQYSLAPRSRTSWRRRGRDVTSDLAASTIHSTDPCAKSTRRVEISHSVRCCGAVSSSTR